MPSAGAIDRSGPDTGEDPAASEVERQRRIVDLLGQAVELEGPARRQFLDRACADDPALRAELDAMLDEDHAITEDFLGSPAMANIVPSGRRRDATGAHEATQVMDSTAAPRSPAEHRIGPYRIIDRLGRGGMGTVYLGEQEEPVRRRVALKVIDAIHDHQQLQRFAAECQALARLNHPNVASLYEVGTTDKEHPYVAMEPVDGTAITLWCDQRRLPLEDRIQLFFGVCAGVRHAHEKGILHRDLKPANVLVTEVDGRPTAKVIDFGIARALGDPLHSGSRPMTLDHQIVGSPAYMCPEIASGERDVDTRSDVYALGLLLYELLAGVPPFETRGVGLGTLLRRILNEDPPAPSARYAELDAERRQEIAAERSLKGPRRLSRRIRGDLDAIVAKALARDPEGRYSSPADLAADLERHLDLRAVGVRASSARYRTWRFIRRHLTMVAAAVLVVGALVIGILGIAREARRANQQADRANRQAERAREALAEAQKLSTFLVDLFEVADPERGREEPADVRQLLDRGAERLQDELGDQPLARALFLHTIGDIYTKMALFEPAEKLIAEALEIRERELGADHPDVLESVNQLGVVYRRQQRLDQAESLLRRVLAARAAQEDDPVGLALALNNLGNLLWSQKRFDEAEAAHRRALEIRQRELGPDDQDVAETLNNLGALYQTQAKNREAEPVLRRAAEIYAETLGTDHPRYAATLFNLSLVEDKLGSWRDAEDHCRTAADVWEAAYGPLHPRTFAARSRLAVLLRRQARYEESVAVYRALLRAREQDAAVDAGASDPSPRRGASDPSPRRGASDTQIRGLLKKLASAQGYLGDFAAAEANYRRVLAFYLEHRGEDHPATLSVRSSLAWLAWRRGDFARAEAAHRRLLEIRRRLHGPEHRRTAWTLHHLALAVADQGRHVEAETLLRQALQIREAILDQDHLDVAATLHHLGRLAGRGGSRDQARRLLDRALEIRRKRLPAGHPDVLATLDARSSIGKDGPQATGQNRE